MEENPREEISGLQLIPAIVIFAVMIAALWAIPEAAKQDAKQTKPAVEASLTP